MSGTEPLGGDGCVNDLPPQSVGETLREILKDTSDSLREALAYWWPAQGNSDVAEAMYILHFGAMLHRHGWLTYAEVQVGGSPDQHIDLVAVNEARQWILKVEAKQLYSAEKARWLGMDWGRLKTAHLPSQHRPLPRDFQQYGCVLASCWADQNKPYIDWWIGDLAHDTPMGARRTADWAALYCALREANDRGVRGAFSVHSEDQAWLLYAVVPLGTT